MAKASISGGGEDGLYNVQIEREDGSSVSASTYCADLTEDLSGNVGLIEIAGDRDKGINIQPGYDGNAVYNETRDGKLHDVPQKAGSQPAEGVYWNWAMRPGWQKWRPNYRYGTITAIDYDADTCDVTLEACTSTDTPDHREMNINQGSSLSDVPVDYMDCNAAAFEVGDEVIVEFQNHDWNSPKVIGFKAEPKPCCEMFEDWSAGICGTRDWYNHGWDQMCYPVPFSYEAGGGTISSAIEDEVLHMVVEGTTTDFWSCTDVDIDGKTPAIGDMKIKVEASGGWLVAIMVYISQYVGCTVKLSGSQTGGDWIDAGDNGGEEQTIDLTEKLAKGTPIHHVTLYAQGPNADLKVDYIEFCNFVEE